MNLASLMLIVGLICLCSSTAIQTGYEIRQDCKQPSLLQFATCQIPNSFDGHGSATGMERASHCETTSRFIKCVSDLLGSACESDDPKVVYFLSNMRGQVQIYKDNYEVDCRGKNL